MSIIYDDEHIQVMRRQGSSAFCLVTFNHRDMSADGRTFWAETFCRSHDLDAIGVVSRRPNWFPSTSMFLAAPAIRAAADKPMIGYGHSMGGYACLKYSALLGFFASIASGPQVTIDPDVVPEDKRYTEHFDPVLNADMQIEPQDLSGRCVIVYDPCNVEDRLHATWLANISSRIETFRMPYMGHRAVMILQAREVLPPLLKSLMTGRPLDDIGLVARGVRHRHPQYLLYLARALLARNKPRLSISILDSLSISDASEFYPERLLLLSRSYTRVNQADNAIAAAERLVTHTPSNTTYQRHYETLVAARPVAT